MSEAQLRPEFTLDEREGIRRALLRYMQENRIGTPTLQFRIIKADQPREREIPLSTLQRFLTGKHHTQDHHVALCRAFVQPLPYYAEDEAMTGLGESLAGFFGQLADAGPDHAEPLRNLAGRFELRLSGVSSDAMPYPPEKPPRGLLTQTPENGKSWLRTQEFFFEPALAEIAPEARYAYEGVTTMAGGLAVVLLRSNLTRRPKLYQLAQRPGSGQENAPVWEGGSFEAESLEFDPAHGLTTHWRIQLVAAEASENDG